MIKYLLIASWIFLPSTYSHYRTRPVVQALPDPRDTTSYYSYRYTRDGFGGYTRIIVRPR